MPQSPQVVARAFVDAINAHDVDRILGLAAEDHEFVDAHGNIVHAPALRAAWTGYLGFMPHYGIELDAVMCEGDLAALFGHAWGSLDAEPDGPRHWRRPTAWKARVSGDRVKLWQVYVDTKIVFDLLSAG